MLVWLSGCSQAGYYFQAARGQLELLHKRQPIEELIDDSRTSAELRAQLILADKIRSYAIHKMALDDNKGFSHYTDLERQYVTWNVVAAPVYSIDAKTWCFPVAGCVAYKGFFEQERAAREKQLLVEQGYDVLLYGVTAYSTLGWFSDPLLSTFIHYKATDLAALIFHEFTHQVVYVQDDSEFNEAFATTVEFSVLNSWLHSRGETERINELESRRLRQNRITEMILDFREMLGQAYKKESRAASKAALFKQLKQDYHEIQEAGEGTAYYDWWFSRELNNADLLSVSTYFRLVPAFSEMLDRHQGNLIEFFAEVKLLAKEDKSTRDQVLQ